MAGVAIHTVVNIASHSLVILIDVRLEVAIRALKDGVVVGIGVAGGTHARRPAVIRVEPGVVEGGAQPARGAMAGRAGSGEAGRNVVRIRGALIIDFVTRVAIGGNRRVVVVHVAVGTRHAGVSAGQRKWRVVVIERCRYPSRRVVADVALLGNPSLHVVGIGCALVILEMTRNAGGAGEPIVSIHVALCALNCGMKASQRPTGPGMIKRCW
jgi:hypothetical protein